MFHNTVTRLLNYIDARLTSESIRRIEKTSFMMAIAGLYSTGAYYAVVGGEKSDKDCSFQRNKMRAKCDQVPMRSAKIKRFFKLYWKATCCLYTYFIVKGILVVMLDLEALKEFRYLDCVLLGRTSINSRLLSAMRYIAPMIFLAFAANKVLLIYRKKEFKLEIIQVSHWKLSEMIKTRYKNLYMAGEDSPNRRKLSDDCQLSDWKFSKFMDKSDERRLNFNSINGLYYRLYSPREPVDEMDRNFFLFPSLDNINFSQKCNSITRHRFLLTGNEQENKQKPSQGVAILKLNRGPSAMLSAYLVLILQGMGYVTGIIFIFGFGSIYAAPNLLTHRGFQLSYFHCVNWIRETNKITMANNSTHRLTPWAYGFIYDPTTDGNFQLDELEKLRRNSKKSIGGPMHLSSDEMIQLNWYHLIRLIFDFSEIYFLYSDVFFTLTWDYIFIILITLDQLSNGMAIKKRLRRLLKTWDLNKVEKYHLLDDLSPVGMNLPSMSGFELDLSAQDSAIQSHQEFHRDRTKSFCLDSIGNERGLGPSFEGIQSISFSQRLMSLTMEMKAALWLNYRIPNLGHGERTLFDLDGEISGNLMSHCPHDHIRNLIAKQTGSGDGNEIFELQMLLIDHFETNLNYSKFIRYYYTFLLTTWIICSITVVHWFLQIKDIKYYFEFYLYEFAAIYCLLVSLIAAAMVHSSNRKLYPLITSLMARDANINQTKTIWSKIIAYYQPRSLFCFTLFNSTELSYKFILQVSAKINIQSRHSASTCDAWCVPKNPLPSDQTNSLIDLSTSS